MPQRPLVQLTAVVVVAVFAVGLWTSGEKVDLGWLRYFSLAVFLAVVALSLWDRWLWKWPWFRNLKFAPTDVHGTWSGTLTSLWVDPVTNTSPASKPAFLVIRQRASGLTVTMLTDESESRSALAHVTRINDQSSLDYMYLNTPDASIVPRSPIHHGSTSLKITGRPGTRLRGSYWTDRHSKGELDFGTRVRQLADDYDEATDAFRSP